MTSGRSGIRHLELGSRDLERSRAFYRGLLGFDEVEVGAAGHERRPTAWFAAGPALVKVVELGDDRDPGTWADEDLQGGLRHAGFKIGDIDAQMRRLEAAGVEVLSPPRDVLGDVRIAFFLDPDGARLELVQGNLRYEHVESPALVQAEADLSLAPGDGARFDHVGLTVADLGATLDLWCGRFGYEVIGDIRHHDDERGFLMTYLAAGGSVLEVFSFDVPTQAPPVIGPEQLGLRGIGVGAHDAAGRATGPLTVRDGVVVEVVGKDG
ncbi:VOC family protein [Cellulomonas sp. KRMCY2]|uniref:VOC family protein n=1 Tax=Cellulomonas sp. KRMCY2 TaxID=1304865 RepID=UPI0004B4F492|nr:VOC family protein [Cellulomonas sp. KRMCY2]